MYGYNSYDNYGYRLRRYFAFGLSKVMDLRNVNQINYPKYMTDEEANDFDARELKKDFENVGKDMRKALKSYGKKHTA
jgi:predicted DNA binding CopG/RHH family protein